jgi:hypothetical protein
MATGIRLPTRVKNGRLELLGGDNYIRQLVETAMGDSESENPFQDVGLGEFMIFDVNDPLSEGEIRDRVERAFDSLERDQLARLSSIEFDRVGGEARMFLEYEDLETGKRPTIEVPLGG